ncbi:MAG: polysaccharide deacetylase family protein [Pseudomonadales bacterium]
MKAILTFHSIDDSGSVLSYPPSLFAQLLENLHNANLSVVNLDTILAPTTQHGVTLTFDDGMRSVYNNALPILRDHAAPAHIFITTNAVGTEQQWPKQPSDVPSFDMLSWDNIEQLHQSGVAIDAHTHPDMRKLSTEQMAAECEQANDEIERRIGRRPEFFAYPFGYHNKQARDYSRKLYTGSVTTELRSLSHQEDHAALPRLDSYYLQSPWLLNNLSSPLTKGYIQLRWLLRTLRGSHCTANYDDQ